MKGPRYRKNEGYHISKMPRDSYKLNEETRLFRSQVNTEMLEILERSKPDKINLGERGIRLSYKQISYEVSLLLTQILSLRETNSRLENELREERRKSNV